MQLMITLSLLLNIAVLVPVCAGMITNAEWASVAYGDTTPAKDILLSVYLAIGMLSAVLLVIRDAKLVAALLAIQIVYKLISPISVGTLSNPVVVSNLSIAAFHAVTLFLIWRLYQAA